MKARYLEEGRGAALALALLEAGVEVRVHVELPHRPVQVVVHVERLRRRVTNYEGRARPIPTCRMILVLCMHVE